MVCWKSEVLVVWNATTSNSPFWTLRRDNVDSFFMITYGCELLPSTYLGTFPHEMITTFAA